MDGESAQAERSSSPPSSSSGNAAAPERSDSTQIRSSPQSFAFLNHSTTTVSDNLPPSVDDKSLARQRRRRTRYANRSHPLQYILLTAYSPEDQAILEAAYARDSKPDKAARLEIVKQVALGEKEVQVSLLDPRCLPCF
jgi:hypothetical protein